MGWLRRGAPLLALLPMAGACGRTPIEFDDLVLGGDDDGPRPSEQQCRDVSFLFVIDNSISMAPYQGNLAANHAVFIDGIREAVDTIETLHVGVVATMPYGPNPTGCNGLGGLVTRTGGPWSSDAECGPYREGHNYMTERDPLDVTFPCAAQVGIGGSDYDAPLSAALSAISPPLTDPGGCNEGFVRPGDLLVLVVIGETYPNASEITPDIDPYFAGIGVSEAMGGFENVVVVAITANDVNACLSPLAPAISQFADLFPNSYEGPICANDYRDVFEPAVEAVIGACPQGRDDG